MFEIIRRPVITEKNSMLANDNTYVFEVDKEATKIQVRAAIEKAFGVKVADVRTMISRGKSRRTQFRVSKVRHWKKAFVRLAPGQKIALFEGV